MQKRIVKIFLEEAWRFPFRTSFSVFNAAVTITVSSFAGPFIIARLLDIIQSGNLTSLSQASGFVILYIITQVYGEVIGWRLTLFTIWTFETAAERNIYNRIFNHLTNQSVSFHANRFGGSLVSQTNKFVGAFERFWDTIIFQLVPSITSVIAATAILAFIFWQYALLILIIAVIFIAIIVKGSAFMRELNVKESQASTKLTGRLADAMTNILAIKSHGHEAYELDQYDKLTVAWRKRSLKSMSGFLKVSSVYSSFIAILNTSALVAALWASSHNIIPISVVYLSVTYTFTVARQLWEMNSIMRNYNRVMGDAHDMAEILGLSSEVQDPENPQGLLVKRGDIEFKNITFAHVESANKPLFESLRLRIKSGEKIGLVGPSGGGKTTLTKLLLRFMDVDSGVITVDGSDIKSVRQDDLRKFISYVPQEPILFHRTLKENIRYGQLDANDEAVIAAAKMAHAHEFITKLPQGYDTLVGERGVKLSGGQRQRVAIARAILKHAPILVLDEATSALDSESESLIQDALWKLIEGRTAIVIAHRLSTIQKMDRIIVLKDGKIEEEGSHKELLLKGGVYAELWQHQTGGFLEE